MYKYLFIFFVSIFWVSPVSAHALPCFNDKESILVFLQKSHGETIKYQGLTESGILVEILNNPESPTSNFTIMTTTADGLTCLRFTGVFWQKAIPHFKKASLTKHWNPHDK